MHLLANPNQHAYLLAMHRRSYVTGEGESPAGEKRDPTRYLAPAISSFIRKKFKEEPDGMGQDDEAREAAEEAWLLDQVWGKWVEEGGTGDWHEVGEEQGNGEDSLRRTIYGVM